VKTSAISTVDDEGMSHIPATSIVFGLLALSCVMVAGFVSALQNANADSTNYGYREPMESAVSHLAPSSGERALCNAARAVTSRKPNV
jgi:hypothetical protein